MKRMYVLRGALTGVCAFALAAPAWAQSAQPEAEPADTQAPDAEPEEEEEAEEIVVQATRTGRRIQDEPIRVEVLNREEIEEKIIMRPGNISMVLAETGGLRVQVTSPGLGASNIRVQGMDGRYTQVLADGLPLYGGQALGLLQITPTDLGQVEVIKGAASALYGSSALGGVINLVSRRPRDWFEAETLLNATTRDGQDLTAYVAGPVGRELGLSLTGGLHRQSRIDLDDDGFIDIPGYERWTVRPRLFWEGESGAKIFATLGAMGEDRVGGTLPGRTVPDGTPYPQTQATQRRDAGFVGELPLAEGIAAQLRGSWMLQDHSHVFGAVTEDDRHETIFAEASVAARSDGRSLVAGVAFQSDAFASATFPAFDYTFTAPGLFAQVEQDLSESLTLAVSGRVDFHSEYGTRLSPRLSAAWRPGPWTIRASYGRGFFAPTPFVDEVDDAGLSRLEPLAGLRAETAETASLDFGWARGPFEANLTLFGSNLDGTARLVTVAPDRVQLVNSLGTTRIRGTEALLRFRRDGFTVTGSYVLVDANEPEPGGIGRRELPLTPRHSAGLVAVWESHGRGRIGVEAYYTGKQSLDDDPFRTESRPYLELGLLGEIVLGRVRLFVNFENITDVRQTRYNSLVRPVRASGGRWTVDAWAPTDGFVANAGIRLNFGGS